MRVVCVSYLHGSGGAERQIINLANAMANYGHEVYLLVLAEYNKKFTISDKVKVVSLVYHEKNKKLKILNRYIAYKKAITKIMPDVSIHFWVQSVYFSYLISEKNKGLVIYSERGDPGDSEYDGLLGVVRNISFGKVRHFVFQSNAAKAYFSKKIQLRSTVIPNAVDISDIIEQQIDSEEMEKTIINIGRLHPQKNQELLINSFARIADTIPDYTLKIYGEGELEKKLKRLIHLLHLEDRIVIYPPTSNIHNIILKSSLFVLSSDFEGMPNVLLESMAMGRICISTDYKPGGVKDIIHDGENGFVIPANDEIALSEKMLYVIKNIGELHHIANHAREIRFSHSYEKIYSNWNSLLESIKK